MKKTLKSILAIIVAVTMIFPASIISTKSARAAGIQVKNTSPSANAAVNSYITIEFYDPIQSYTYFNNITLKDSMGNIVSCWKQVSGNAIIIKSYSDLNANTKYTVSIPESAIRQTTSPYLGNEAYSFTFTTTPNISPLYIQSISASYYGVLAINSSIDINFSKKIQKGYNFDEIKLRDSEGNQIAYKATITNQTLEIKPNKDMEYNTRYYIYIPEGGVKDLGNNYYNNSYTCTFMTELDTAIPKVKITSPKEGEKSADRKKSITIQFDKKIEKGYYFDYIILRDADGNSLTKSCEINGNTITVTPEALNSDAYYKVEIPAGAVYNAGGSPYYLNNTTYTLTFTTGTDKTPPEVVSSNPIDGQKYVAINNPISVTFSKSILLTSNTGNTKSVDLKDGKGSVPIRTYINGNVMQITLEEGLNLSYDTKYTLTISSNGIKDFSGNKLKQNYTVSFTTEPQMPNPKIISSSPKYNEMNFSPQYLIKTTYDETIQKGEKFSSIELRDRNNNKVYSTPVIIDNTLYIVPGRDLQNDEKYSFIIPAGAVKNVNGDIQKDTYTYVFKTEKEKIPPEVRLVYPADNAENTAVDSDIVVTFTEKVQKGDNFSGIVLKNIYDEVIPITPVIDSDKLVIRLNNSLNMTYNMGYILTVPQGAIKDITGNELQEDFTSRFKTGNGNFSPVVKMIKTSSPVPIDSDVDIIFSSNIQLSDNSDNIVVKGQDGKIIEVYKSTMSDKLVLTPAYPLKLNTVYTVTIPEVSVQDENGNIMKRPYVFSFRTENEKVPPVIKSVYPKNNTKNVATKTGINVKFSEAIKLVDINKVLIKNNKGYKVLFSAQVSKDTLILKPQNELTNGLTYTVSISRGAIQDMAGNNMSSASYSYKFTTITKQELQRIAEAARKKAEAARKAEAERQRLKNDKTAPTMSSGGLSKDSRVITLTFSENIAKGSDFGKIQVLDLKTNKKLSLSASIKGKSLTITIKSTMKKGNQYGFIVPAKAIRDIAGNTIAQDIKNAFVKAN